MSKGVYVRTEEMRKNISLAKLGKKNPKLSETRKKLILEGKIKIPNNKGNIPWNKGLKGVQKCSEQARKNMSIAGKARIFTEEHKQKIGLAHLGKSLLQEHRNKISLAKKGIPNLKCSATRKKLIVEGKIKIWSKGLTKETDERVNKNAINTSKTKKRLFAEGKLKVLPETREKLSVASKKNWQNEEYRDTTRKKMFKSLRLRPNKPEQVMIKLIQENNLPFNYTGNGKIIMGGFNPDFLSKNPKHIIEVNGDFWHNLPENIEKDKRKLKAYASLGYKTLTIWEHELKEPQKVVEKIRGFII